MRVSLLSMHVPILIPPQHNTFQKKIENYKTCHAQYAHKI